MDLSDNTMTAQNNPRYRDAMNMLNQIKIGPRLALAFGCLLILMAMIAISG